MADGFQDKLYWRPKGLGFHCFKKVEGGGFQSLCGVFHREKSGGGECARPPAWARCVFCDLREMKRRGVEESMPCTNDDWKKHL